MPLSLTPVRSVHRVLSEALGELGFNVEGVRQPRQGERETMGRKGVWTLAQSATLLKYHADHRLRAAWVPTNQPLPGPYRRVRVEPTGDTTRRTDHRVGSKTARTQPSSLFLNMLYPCGASSSGMVCVARCSVTSSPRAIRSSNIGM